jgi:adenosine deaminase
MSVLIDSSDFEALAWDYFEHAFADGVMHAEVFFDPQAHLERGVTYETILTGFGQARKRAELELGISSELICCFLRHLPASACHATFSSEAVQKSFAQGEIIGIGLDSSEKDFPPELFTSIYSQAKTLGMRRTAHAGEEGPSSFIQTSLDELHVERIDHGIRLAENPALLARVAKEGTLLTVCPMSNVLLRCVTKVSELPIRTFLDAGIRFSINSDDPAYFGNNYILDNYCAVQNAFDLSVAEWKTICENGIRGSWCSDARKKEMLAKLEDVVAKWQASQ